MGGSTAGPRWPPREPGERGCGSTGRPGRAKGPDLAQIVEGDAMKALTGTVQVSSQRTGLDLLRGLWRHKWMMLVTLIVTGAGLWFVLWSRTVYQAACLMAVKKPYMILSKPGQDSSGPVPLLEGPTYKEMADSIDFSARVAQRFKAQGVQVSAEEVQRRLKPTYKDPDLLRLTARSSVEPQAAIQLANTACETLLQLNQKELRAELELTEDALERLLGDAEADFVAAQRNLAEYALKHKLTSVDFNSNSPEFFRTLELLDQQEISRAKEDAALQAAEDRLRELKTQREGRTPMPDFPVEPPSVTTLRTQMEAARVKLWDARKQFTDVHPTVKGYQTQLNELQAELDREVRAAQTARNSRPAVEHDLAISQKIAETNQEIGTRKAQIAAWSRLIDEQRKLLSPVPTLRAELEPMKKKLAFAEHRYRTLRQRLDEARVSLGAARSTISIVQPANGVEPPNTLLLALASGGLMVTLPVGVGLLLAQSDRTVRSPMVLSRRAGVPCLAVVPRARGLHSGRALRGHISRSSLGTFQVLRSGLRFASNGLQLRRVGIVGVRRGEGRSTLVLHLARVLAEDGRQVMVVDANLRSPNLGRMLRADSPGGLVEVLTGEARLEDVLQRDTPVNAMLLTAAADGEPLPPNTEVLFRGPRCEGVMEDLSRLADIVLFDTAPLLDYPDTLELLPHLDAVIFVTQAGSASEDDVQQGLDLIRSGDPEKLLGVVLNKVTK